MRIKKSFLYMLAIITSITIVWAGLPSLPALGDTKTGTPENGKKYYIYADTYSGGQYVNRYLYNNNGTLALSTSADELSDNYVWTCTVTDGKYTFQNVGDNTKYLAHKELAGSAYNFTLGKANANHEGTTIWSDNAGRYLVTKNDGTSFNQATSTYNQTNSDWCTDYVFVEYVEPSGNSLRVTGNIAGVGTLKVNGKAVTLPYTTWANIIALPTTLTATTSNPYKFEGFFNGEDNLGTSYTINSLDESASIEARFALDIFSESLENPVPVKVYNSRDKSYAVKMNSASNYSGKTINSGVSAYSENEIWYLVGNESSFKMYSRTAGNNLAITLSGTGQNSPATLTAEGTELCLVKSNDGYYGICPTANTAQSFNMHGGNGNDIKLYDITDGGSKWMFKRIATDKALTLNYNTQLEGGYEQNYKIGELSINIDGTQSKTMLEKSNIPASKVCYLPEGAVFGISTGFMCHGWTMDINGTTSINEQTLPAGGLTVDINIAVDRNNLYQYLYYSPGPNGHPYRIPAIATTANGYVFAINDFRPCGGDIGNGDVDLVMRHSTVAGEAWDGYSWTESVTIANGEGHQAHTNGETWKVGYGDPAIVADRENNELLVMSVCGNRLCWNGNYGAGTEENPENPNRVSRIRIKYNENTKQWVAGAPEEVTYDIYPIFDDAEGNHHVGSMFIGAGRIAQSSKIKVGTHYRIYCAVWAVQTGSSRYHNYAIYSDDFGESWKVLGELGWDNCPAKYGNEPKCEELPDGSVLLSSRKGYGRYFNVFRYTNQATGEGYWEGEVSTDAVGDLKWGSNDTNGEPLRIGNVLFQSVPTGNSRSDVAVFYKVLSNDPADYTPTKLSNGWTKIAISNKESAYSSMCILPDGNIGIFYEEAPGGYSMVYRPMILKDILPANVYDALSALPPTYASEASPVWHNIVFSNSGNILRDNGADNNVTTVTAEENDACMWNIVGTREQFYLVSKLGNYLAYDATNNRYKTTSDKAQKTALTLKENVKGSWEIMRKGAKKSMSELNASRSVGNEVADAKIKGTGNQVIFNDLTPAPVDPDIFSTEEEPAYYQVVFQNGSWALTDKGAGNKVLTAAKADGADQLWQLVGTPEAFYIKSKNGNYLANKTENGTIFYYTTDATADKTMFNTFKTGNSNYSGAYEIQREGATQCMNMYQGAGANKKISEWNVGDGGNPVKFISEPPYPRFSTADSEYYYFIQFGNGEAVIQDMGVDSNVLTKGITAEAASQLWKFTGTKDNCQIINKNGNYLIYTDSRIKTSTTADERGFKIVATGNNNYAGMFELQHLSSSNTAFNMNGGAGKDKEIALYTSNDSGNPLQFVKEEDVQNAYIPTEFSIAESGATAPAEKLTMWYTKPATATGVSNTWMEYSLPLGNGQLGASLFGGVARDEILINEKTLWSGGPNEYGYYLPFGSVYIDDISGNFTTDDTKPVKNYYRDLNLNTATGTVTYEDNNGVKYTRQYIASNPDNVVMTKITASQPGKLSFRISLESGKPTVNATTTYNQGYAQFSGKLQTLSYNATMKVVATGGYTSTGADGIIVEEADEVTVIITASTDFVGNQVSHINGRAEYLPADNKAIVDAADKRGWNTVYAEHVADHQKFFTRVNFEIDGSVNNLPTNELIDEYNRASGTRNLMLEQLYYNYGRYLSIASSRGADLPNNLQGIWNNTCTPPWHSDIHANINVQMNYWPVSAGNLSEMYEPFLNYIINEAAQPEWQNRATIAGETRGWTCLTENNIFGGISGFAPNYVIANAWYVTHMWQHYRYTLDKEYLAKAFPAMKGAALFWADRMELATDGTYECPNEYSPEHGPGSEDGVAHAQQIAWEAIDNTIKAADVLGGVEAGIIADEDYALLKDRLEKMDKGLATEVYNGEWGNTYNGVATGDTILREWKYTSTFATGKNIERAHRHMSHLMALFPFGQLTPASKFFEPAINSMKLRGDESTGWSMGWKINLWARALMADRSHAILRKALKHSTSYATDQSRGGIYYNLFDSHAPFQIDGNFGATSGINEMLLQSHTDVIDILPALPTEWSKGHIKGLKAIGNFTVDIMWEGNQARKVTIINNEGQPCYVKCANISGASVTVNGTATTIGEEKTVNNLKCYQIASNKGDKIVIDLSNAVQSDKSALATLITETEELINNCLDYYSTEVALQTTDPEGAYYISTNADHNAYNSTKDGQGIAGLVDGNPETFLHTNWNNGVTAITEPHRIDVNLGTDNETSSFIFKYATRKTQTDFPKTIEIYGKHNGEYELIKTVTDLPVGNSSETKYYKSPVINSENSYSEIRFVVTATNSGKTANGLIFFHMAEFDFIPRTAEPVNNYPNAVNVPASIEKAKTEVTNAQASLNATQTAAEYNASLKALQTAYDELVAAIESGSLPVLVTTDTNNPLIYKIGIGRANYAESVLEYDLLNTNMISVANYNGNKFQAWYFTKGSTDGKVYIHPYVGGGDVLSAKSTSNAPAAVWSAVKGEETHQEWTISVVNSDNGTYNIKAGDGSNYFSNNGGYTNKMGFWSGSPSSDGGSLFTFARIEQEGGIWENTLSAYKERVPFETVPEGTAVGSYADGTEYNDAYETAVSTLADEYSVESTYQAAYLALRHAKENLKLIMPSADKFYLLRCKYENRYLYTNADNKMQFDPSTDKTSSRAVWQFEAGNAQGTYKMKSMHTQNYVQAIVSGQQVALGETGADVIIAESTKANGAMTFTIDGNLGLHANGSSNTVIGWGNTADSNHYFFEEITDPETIKHIVAVQGVGYSTLKLGYPVVIPENVKAYTISETIENSAMLSELTDYIPANTAVIIEAGQGSYNFYYTNNEVDEADNMLDGTLYNKVITPAANETYYILGVGNNSEVGLYQPLLEEAEGTAFLNNANKAYLCIPEGSKVKFFSFSIGGGTTGIEGVESDETLIEEIYDLQGRKVKEITAPGMYIINGKATIVK